MIVALEGLENILRVGEQQKTGEFNEIATLIDEADGVNKIQSLQYHANEGKLALMLEGYIAARCEVLTLLFCVTNRHLHEVDEDRRSLLQRRGGRRG